MIEQEHPGYLASLQAQSKDWLNSSPAEPDSFARPVEHLEPEIGAILQFHDTRKMLHSNLGQGLGMLCNGVTFLASGLYRIVTWLLLLPYLLLVKLPGQWEAETRMTRWQEDMKDEVPPHS